MKKILFIINCFIISLILFSCEKEAYKPANVIPTPTYRLYNPVYTVNLMDSVYEMFVYRDIPQLTIYKGQQYSMCFVEKIMNFKDNSTDEMYSFSFDRIMEKNKDGSPKTLYKYIVESYKDQSTHKDELTGEPYRLESSLLILDSDGKLINKYDNIGVLERTRYIE